MNTLQTPEVATLLNSLFAEARRSERSLRMPRGLDPLSKTTYGEFYAAMSSTALAVSRRTGLLLYSLIRSTRATEAIEFGTSFGISAIYIAAALRDNGGGKLITTEFESSKVQRAKQNLSTAGLLDLVEVREGDALDTLAKDLPTEVGLLLLDGAKGLYLDVLSLVKPRLRPGAVVLADDSALCPAYVQTMRHDTGEFLSVPITGEVEMSTRLR